MTEGRVDGIECVGWVGVEREFGEFEVSGWVGLDGGDGRGEDDRCVGCGNREAGCWLQQSRGWYLLRRSLKSWVNDGLQNWLGRVRVVWQLDQTMRW